MTPERQVYAIKRVTRLNAKIVAIDAAMRGFRPNTPRKTSDYADLTRQRISSIAARKCWLKELQEAAS